GWGGEAPPPYLSARRGAGVRVDYMGIALLTLAVGALQILLDKGQEEDWFGSRFIVTLALVSAVCFLVLIVWEWRHESPIVDVRMFGNFNFPPSGLMMFALALLLFAMLGTTPQL